MVVEVAIVKVAREVRDIICTTINSNHQILTALTSYFALFAIGLINANLVPRRN